jgi:ATP-dependent RNA helicase DeaD
MTTAFTELNLRPQLIQAVTELGYRTPTPIQAAVIPAMLAGGDVIGQAQTGTGKTAAFALPILHNLQPQQKQVQSLILAPTRELALQVAQAIYTYGQHQGVRVLAVYGGQPYERQIRRLQRGVQVVVGTPGRLLDLIHQNVLDLSAVRTLVLDEADEMLSMGFIEDIEAILADITAPHQTALFSATVPPPIRRLADRYMSHPESITIETGQRTVASIHQQYYLVREADKIKALTRLVEVEDITSALIFARTRVDTTRLANELSLRGFPAEALNGDLSQPTREHVLKRFQSHQLNVLVATDIAARGLDIGHLSHVINFDLPQFPEGYVHRVGRTARAGKSGVAITLLTPNELWRLHKIEAYTRQKITPAQLPTMEVIEAKREAELVERLTVWLKRGRYSQERQIATQLAQAGYDPIEIAAAAIKILRAEEKRRPIEPIEDVTVRRSRDQKRDTVCDKSDMRRAPRHTSHEKGMVRLTFSAGKRHGVRPNDVVGTIAHHAQIPGRTIGSIRIQEDHTTVDIPDQFVAQVLAKTGHYQVHKQKVSIERAAP